MTTPSTASAISSYAPKKHVMLEQLLALLKSSDSYVAIEFLNQHEDLAAAAVAYRELLRHLYWEAKDIPRVIIIARAGIQFGLEKGATVAAANPELAYELKSQAKALAYDLASFTWPGWDETGIAPGATDTALGLDAALTNLRLAHELDKGSLPLSRAHWMLAAHLLAQDDPAAARAQFEQAERFAAEAEQQAEQLLCAGFAGLCGILLDADDEQTLEELNAAKKALQEVEHGHAFIDQIETARRVFSKS